MIIVKINLMEKVESVNLRLEWEFDIVEFFVFILD